jgi:hypothetical protein
VDFIEPEESIVEAAVRFGLAVAAFGKDYHTYGGLKKRLYEGMIVCLRMDILYFSSSYFLFIYV